MLPRRNLDGHFGMPHLRGDVVVRLLDRSVVGIRPSSDPVAAERTRRGEETAQSTLDSAFWKVAPAGFGGTLQTSECRRQRSDECHHPQTGSAEPPVTEEELAWT
jgi:hypothetical protein